MASLFTVKHFRGSDAESIGWAPQWLMSEHDQKSFKKSDKDGQGKNSSAALYTMYSRGYLDRVFRGK